MDETALFRLVENRWIGDLIRAFDYGNPYWARVHMGE